MDALPLNLPCRPQEDLNDALKDAVTDKVHGLVALLLEHGAQVTEAVFRRACNSNDLVVFQAFLDHRWDINSRPFGEPTLRYEALPDLERLLIHPNKSDDTKRGSRTLVLRTWGRLEATWHSGFHAPYDSGYSGYIGQNETSSDNGVDINRQEPRGTALHIAVDIGDPVLMRWLLDHGADREIQTVDGLTAADWAKEIEELEMLKLLQDHK
ncbi:ankyrin [Penicillium subrubescens]|uniref:ankyrin n=1 Tax=Penicillium subrubescens TaxID=1316194 RepID=UPI0025450F98|nr:ankyrin [Penicillium subrubescens]KAJ5900533.1 ankyrin [Penicillium subrubescens]